LLTVKTDFQIWVVLKKVWELPVWMNGSKQGKNQSSFIQWGTLGFSRPGTKSFLGSPHSLFMAA